MLVVTIYTVFITICMSLFMMHSIQNTQRELQSHTLNDTFLVNIEDEKSVSYNIDSLFETNEYIHGIIYNENGEYVYKTSEGLYNVESRDFENIMSKQIGNAEWGSFVYFDGVTFIPQYVKVNNNMLILLYPFYL